MGLRLHWLQWHNYILAKCLISLVDTDTRVQNIKHHSLQCHQIQNHHSLQPQKWPQSLIRASDTVYRTGLQVYLLKWPQVCISTQYIQIPDMIYDILTESSSIITDIKTVLFCQHLCSSCTNIYTGAMQKISPAALKAFGSSSAPMTPEPSESWHLYTPWKKCKIVKVTFGLD